MAENTEFKVVVGADIADIKSKMAELSGIMSNLSNNMNASSTRIQNSVGGMASNLKSVLSTLAPIIGGLSFAGFIKSSIENAATLQQTAVAFEVFTGSAKVANDMLVQLKDQALKSPMQFQDITKGAQTLLGYGLTAEQVIPVTKMLGDISGGNADKFGRLALAFGQVNAAGRLMGQETRQMINAGFNPLQAIADKTGKSMAQLTQDMKNGRISVNDVAQAFVSATSEGGRFFGMAEKQSNTVGGALNKLRESLFFISADFGAYASQTLDVQGSVNGLTNFLTNLGASLNPIIDNFKEGTILGTLFAKAFDILKGSIFIAIGVINGALVAFNKLAEIPVAIYNKFAEWFPRIAKLVENVYNLTIGLVGKLGNELSKNDKIDNITDSISSMKSELEGLQKLKETQILIKLPKALIDDTSKSIAKLKQDIDILEKTTARSGQTSVSGFSKTPTGLSEDTLKKDSKIYERLALQARLGFTEVNKSIRTGFETKLDIFDRYAKEELDRLTEHGLNTTKVEQAQYKLRQQIAKMELGNLSALVNRNISIPGLKSSFDKMYEAQSKKAETLMGLMGNSISKFNDNNPFKFANPITEFQSVIGGLSAEKEQNSINEYANSIYSAFENFNMTIASGFSEMAGTALSGGFTVETAFKSLGAMFLNIVGDLLIQIGTSAIKLGVGKLAIEAALNAFGGAGIVAGMAAVAAGTALKSLAGKVTDSMSATSSASTPSVSSSAYKGITGGGAYQYGGSSYSSQSMKLSIDLTGAITASPTGYNINKSFETVLRVTGR